MLLITLLITFLEKSCVYKIKMYFCNVIKTIKYSHQERWGNAKTLYDYEPL